MALVAVVVAVIGTRPPAPPADDATILTVNGESVPFEEMKIFLEQNRAAVAADYRTKVNVGGDKFWTTSVNGTTPQAELLTRATEQVVRQSIQFQLAASHKLIRDPTFLSFDEQWTSENMRRRQALSTGTPIYGPQQYSQANYLAYLTGNIAQTLQDAMVADGTIIVTDDEMRTYYDAHRSEFSPAGQAGPAADNFQDASDVIRKTLIAQSYDAVVSAREGSATVTSDPSLRLISASGCLASGQC